ncbi:hypothetical protein BC835DRAFT_1454524 [Cytidiella melzeri]|nr:hypothetical protein BC835DRAFT_1454524 [Cytidiella melzeri]
MVDEAERGHIQGSNPSVPIPKRRGTAGFGLEQAMLLYILRVHETLFRVLPAILGIGPVLSLFRSNSRPAPLNTLRQPALVYASLSTCRAIQSSDGQSTLTRTKLQACIHMDDCFEGRYQCTRCKTVFRLSFSADEHCRCRTSEGFTVMDPIPHWRVQTNRRFLLRPHPDDHLWRELGYDA